MIEHVASSASIRTPGVLMAHAACPRCGVETPILVNLGAELRISDDGTELRVKTKTRGVAHICGQLPLPEPDQTTLTEALAASRDESDPFYALVADGETLEQARARIDALPTSVEVFGTPAGQALLEALADGRGSHVPYPRAES